MLDKKYNHKEVKEAFYHIKYYLEVATTRPETLSGSNLDNSRVVEKLKSYFIQLFRQRKEVM